MSTQVIAALALFVVTAVLYAVVLLNRLGAKIKAEIPGVDSSPAKHAVLTAAPRRRIKKPLLMRDVILYAVVGFVLGVPNAPPGTFPPKFVAYVGVAGYMVAAVKGKLSGNDDDKEPDAPVDSLKK